MREIVGEKAGMGAGVRKHPLPLERIHFIASKSAERSVVAALAKTEYQGKARDPKNLWLVVTPVYRGLEFVARYKAGVLTTLLLAGDGIMGEDIVHLAPALKIPAQLACQRLFYLHGTFTLNKDDFFRLKKEEDLLAPKALGTYSLEQLLNKAIAGKAVSPVVQHIRHRIHGISIDSKEFVDPHMFGFIAEHAGLCSSYDWECPGSELRQGLKSLRADFQKDNWQSFVQGIRLRSKHPKLSQLLEGTGVRRDTLIFPITYPSK